MNDYITSNLMPYDGEHSEVGIGHKFTEFDDGEIHVQQGDLVAFDDPDAGSHAGGCELTHTIEMVGYVDYVYAVDYGSNDGWAVEVGTTAPVGRLGVDDPYTGIVTENAVYGGMNESRARELAGILVDHGEYDDYFVAEWHLGEDGVPDDYWNQFDESDRSGPGCDVCTGSGHKTEGE